MSPDLASLTRRANLPIMISRSWALAEDKVPFGFLATWLWSDSKALKAVARSPLACAARAWSKSP